VTWTSTVRNSGNVLPLKKNAKVYVAGRNADNIGNQAGGWTVQWQGVSGGYNKNKEKKLK
jgi:beta-glucosidase